MLQIDGTVRSGYEKVIIVSPDTDSFVTAYTIIQNVYIYIYIYIYIHYSSRIVDDSWKRRNETSRAIPLHQVSTKLETNVVDILPALHALTGCDD